MDPLEQAMQKVPLERRCIQSDTGEFQNSTVGTCYFGVPSYDLYGRVPLEKLPDKVRSIHFLGGSDQAELVEAFVRSPHAMTVEHLSVGCSSYSREFPLDYTAAIAPLAKAECPNLRSVELGVWTLFANAHCAFGRMGNISDVLRNLAHVGILSLYGNFELDGVVVFPKLKELNVELDDDITALNGGPISQATLTHLCNSSFPKLRELFWDLDCDGAEEPYVLSPEFLAGEHVPGLGKAEITGVFAKGQKELLRKSPLGQRVNVLFTDDMHES